jgi:hypothetical protein
MNFVPVEPEKYLWRPLFTDLLTGLAALVLVFMVALRLGGFSFFLPWLIVIPLGMFLAGFLRGSSPGSAWAKAVTISSPLLLIAVSVQGATFLIAATGKMIALLITVIPTAGGVLLRRYWDGGNGDIGNSR